MRISKKCISLFTTAVMLTSVCVSASAEYKIKSSFDDMEMVSVPETASSGNFTSDSTTFWLQSQLGQTFNTTSAPSPEGKYSSFTSDGGEDKAVQIKIAPYTADSETVSPSGTAFMSSNSLSGDLYEKGSLSISLNVYAKTVKNVTHVPLRVELRNSSNTSTLSPLIDFRSGSNLRFSDNQTYTQKYSTGKWYNVKVDINTKEKTYKAYVDGVQVGTTDIPMSNQTKVCFGGDPSADSLVTLNQLRITTGTAKNVTSDSSEVYFDDLYLGDKVSNSVEEISLDSFCLTDGESEAAEVVYSEDALTANAEFTYSEKTEPLYVSMYGAVFGSNKILKKLYAADDTIPQASSEGDFKKTVSLPMSFTGEDALEDGDRIKVFLWNGTTMQELSDEKVVTVNDGKNYKYTADFEDSTEIDDYRITLGNADKLTTSILSDDLTGVQGNALKIVASDVASSGYPYITIDPKETLSATTVYVDYKLYCADNGSATHPRTLSINGSDAYLLEYRPTAAINYYPSGSAVSSGKSFTRWAWDKYHLEINLEEGTYTALINDKEIGTGEISATTLENLKFTIGYNKNYTSGSSITYIDDIKVYVD